MSYISSNQMRQITFTLNAGISLSKTESATVPASTVPRAHTMPRFPAPFLGLVVGRMSTDVWCVAPHGGQVKSLWNCNYVRSSVRDPPPPPPPPATLSVTGTNTTHLPATRPRRPSTLAATFKLDEVMTTIVTLTKKKEMTTRKARRKNWKCVATGD